MLRLFHVSDLHFGRPAVPEQVEAIEALIQSERFDVVAISGDFAQRARFGEFQRAQVFLRDTRKVSQVISVPGNHDVAWWEAPLGVRDRGLMYANYRAFVSEELEPVMRVEGEGGVGATIVGLNTSHGVTLRTLTWNMRDLSVIGDLTPSQIERARREFAASREDDARIVLMHHNPVKGELSQRHGLKNTRKILGRFAEMGVDLVLCGHDHQEAIHYIEHTKKGTIISTAGTVSNRSRGGRPSSANVITIGPETIEVNTLVWSRAERAFHPGPSRCFER
ncbi:MAG TPA: metallophosphoesterase [Gemmatimonadaceae bacterium]|nr:metallophosphoesterase [Gemmatimonadaceae bacterium]